jgi:hypothetical protein
MKDYMDLVMDVVMLTDAIWPEWSGLPGSYMKDYMDLVMAVVMLTDAIW